MVGINHLLIDGIVLILAARRDHVEKLTDIGIGLGIDVFGKDRILLRIQSGRVGIASVDKRSRHIGQNVEEHARFRFANLDLDVVLRDVGLGRDIALGRIAHDETCGFKHLQGTASVGEVARDGENIAVLDVLHGLELIFVVEDAKRRDERVADRFDLVTVSFDVVFQIGLVLEGIEIDFTVGKRTIGRCIVGKLHELDLNLVLLKKLVDRIPLRVVVAHNTHLHDRHAGSGRILFVVSAARKRHSRNAQSGQSSSRFSEMQSLHGFLPI